MATSATHLYWTADLQDQSNITQSPIGGGQATQTMTSAFGSGHPHACGVAVDDTYVYWANRELSKISRAELANFGQAGQVIDENFILLGTGVLPCGIAVDDTYVYWGIYRTGGINGAHGTTVGRAQKADGGGATNEFVGGGNMVTGVALDEDFIYWSNNNGFGPTGGSIGRANKNGTGVNGSFISGLNSPWGVAVDGLGPAAAPPTPTPPQLPNPPTRWRSSTRGEARGHPARPGSGRSGCGTTSGRRRRRTRHSTATPPARCRAARVFSFVLDRAATVKIAIQRRTRGRKVGRTCRAPSRRLRRKPACRRFATQVTLTRRARAGLNKVPFTGRIRGRALKPGSYRAVFTATATGAARSTASTVAFRIVRP